MIVKEEFLKKLRSAFSLNIYEVKIWTALLLKGIATAGELSDLSDVPRSRTYDVLESLEKKGFIIMKLGRPIKYISVKPKDVIKRAKRDIVEKSQITVDMLENIKGNEVYEELSLLFKQGIDHVEPENLAGAFKGRKNIYDSMINIIKNAEKSVTLVTTDEGIIRKCEILKPLFKKLKQKNVKIRIAAPFRSERAKEVVKELRDTSEIKQISMDARFLLVDDKEALFITNKDTGLRGEYENGVWVNSPFFVAALKDLFNAYMEK